MIIIETVIIVVITENLNIKTSMQVDVFCALFIIYQGILDLHREFFCLNCIDLIIKEPNYCLT